MARMRMRKKNMKKKMELVKDERGQWIISAGFLVSVSIIILALLLNQAMMGGYQSSAAILEFPKHEIRELVQETHREVIIAADRANTHNTTEKDVRANFTIANFTNQTLRIYATHGQMVYMNVSSLACNITTHKIEKVNVTILFSDGVTTCTFEPEVIEMPGVPEQVPGPSNETLYAVKLSCKGCNITSPANASNASDGFVANVSDVGDGDTVNATIGNHTAPAPGDMIGNATFKIKLKNGTGWVDDVLNISYSPNNGSDWYSAASNVSVPTNLNWTVIYSASGVDTWAKVDNMTIRITGVKVDDSDNGNLSIDAYHVYVDYQP